MANFVRTDVAGFARTVIDTGPLAAEIDVRVFLPLGNGEEIRVDLTRAEIVAATTAAERSNTRSLLDKLRGIAVTKAGGI